MDALLTADELAKLLKISARKLEYMIHEGQVPPYLRLGRLRRWRSNVISAWLDEIERENANDSTKSNAAKDEK